MTEAMAWDWPSSPVSWPAPGGGCGWRTVRRAGCLSVWGGHRRITIEHFPNHGIDTLRPSFRGHLEIEGVAAGALPDHLLVAAVHQGDLQAVFLVGLSFHRSRGGQAVAISPETEAELHRTALE